jgi:uncharacterized protein HemX
LEPLINILEKHGLGVALAAGVGCVAWYLLRYIMNSHKEDRKTWRENIEMQHNLVTNHLSHLEQSNALICKSLEQHDKNSEKNTQQIVSAIESQTKVFKALYEMPGGR